MRIIVTGERDWLDRNCVRNALSATRGDFGDFTLVHGACPTGADKFADEWASDYGVEVERFPADWAAEGQAAGPKRNRRMVDAGADLVLAFWSGRVKRSGTFDCFCYAVTRGIPARIFSRLP